MSNHFDEAVFVDMPEDLSDRLADELRDQFDVSDADTVLLHIAGALLEAGWTQPPNPDGGE